MVEACKQAGIYVTAYTTIVWDEHMATQHPAWQQVDEYGKFVGSVPFNADHFKWQWLLSPFKWQWLLSPYIDYMEDRTAETLIKGIVRMFLETHYQFNLLDAQSDFHKISTVHPAR